MTLDRRARSAMIIAAVLAIVAAGTVTAMWLTRSPESTRSPVSAPPAAPPGRGDHHPGTQRA